MATTITIPTEDSSLVQGYSTWNLALPTLFVIYGKSQTIDIRRPAPQTGPPDSFGEKPCYHRNIKHANVVAIPWSAGSGCTDIVSSTTSSYYITPTYRLQNFSNANINTIGIHCISAYGAGGTFSGSRHKVAHMQWQWEGDTVSIVRYWRVGDFVISRSPRSNNMARCDQVEYNPQRNQIRFRSGTEQYTIDKDFDPWALGKPGLTAWSGWQNMTGSRRLRLSGYDSQSVQISSQMARGLVAEVAKPDVVEDHHLYDWRGLLSWKMAEQTKDVDTNLLTIVPEIIRLRRSIKKFIDDVINPNTYKSVRRLADLHLSNKYGARLTVKEIFDIIRRLRRYKVRRNNCTRARARLVHSSTRWDGRELVPCTVQYHGKLWYLDTAASQLMHPLWALEQKSLIPTWRDVWDKLPFTFVVDWFISVESVLAQIDSKRLISDLPVKGVVFSSRSEWDVNLESVYGSNLGISGTLHLVEYRREVGKRLVIPRPTSIPGGGTFNNWFELAALTIQRFIPLPG